MDNLDENFWNTARQLIPEDWRSDQFELIKSYFTAISENKDAFILELKKLMSMKTIHYQILKVFTGQSFWGICKPWYCSL